MKTFLDWSSYTDAGLGDAYADIPKSGGNFAKAVAVCINSRQCETLGKGVMCPSFRVTEDPHLSTGGRVKLLKQALNEAGVMDALLDPQLQQSMALCVACKGCKRECENAVDMTMIKTEYLAQQNTRNGISLRSRLLAHLPKLLQRYPTAIHRAVKWRNNSAILRKLGAALLGISAAHRLPEAHSATTQNLDYIDTTARSEQPTREVVLFVDTFTQHYAPENLHATVALLTRSGYQVTLLRPPQDNQQASTTLCCGRTYLSQGMVDHAKTEAQRLLDALKPHIEKNRPIIGLEPACVSAIRDDYLFLGLGDLAQTVAKKTFLFEEFLAKELTAKRFPGKFRPADDSEQVLIHGHCHEKAVGAMKSIRKVLKSIPNLKFEFVEASCCGMAGSFGIEKEHAQIAMEMAEQSLLPTIRSKPSATIIANGISCRQQIREGCERASLHLAAFLNTRLV